MKQLLAGLACTLLVASCASEPESPATAQRDCRSADARTGSHMIRRSDCDRAARAGGEAETRQLEAAQRLQTLPGIERR